jgi:hypothetical protein
LQIHDREEEQGPRKHNLRLKESNRQRAAEQSQQREDNIERATVVSVYRVPLQSHLAVGLLNRPLIGVLLDL